GCSSQRHVLADLGNRVGNPLCQRDVADFRRLYLLHVGADGKRDVRDHLDQTLEQIVTRHKIGFGVDFDHDALGVFMATPISPSAAIRPAFFAALASPRLRNRSTACPIAPAVSCSADLQSIMPAPVRSRSSFTICAVMLAICIPLSAPLSSSQAAFA